MKGATYVTAIDSKVPEKHLIQVLKFSQRCYKQVRTQFPKSVRGTDNKLL